MSSARDTGVGSNVRKKIPNEELPTPALLTGGSEVTTEDDQDPFDASPSETDGVSFADYDNEFMTRLKKSLSSCQLRRNFLEQRVEILKASLPPSPAPETRITTICTGTTQWLVVPGSA